MALVKSEQADTGTDEGGGADSASTGRKRTHRQVKPTQAAAEGVGVAAEVKEESGPRKQTKRQQPLK